MLFMIDVSASESWVRFKTFLFVEILKVSKVSNALGFTRFKGLRHEVAQCVLFKMDVNRCGHAKTRTCNNPFPIISQQKYATNLA
jgi:hypothetical protein